MDETRLRADNFRQMSQKRDDIMFDFSLDLIDPRDIERCGSAFFPNGLGRVARDNAEFCKFSRGVRFDFEPNPKLAFR